MSRQKRSLLSGIILILILFSVGCGQTKDASATEEENSKASEVKQNNKSRVEKEGSNSNYEKPTTFKDIEGYWNGKIGNVSIHLFEGKTGEISFLDNHASANLIFNDYKSKDSALEFEIDPATSGYENHDPFQNYNSKIG